MKTPGGKATFSVLLTQDIAVIPMLALLPLLAMPAVPHLDPTGAIHTHDRQRNPTFHFERQHHFEHRRVLDRRGDDVAAATGLEQTSDGQVVRFRSPGREHDFSVFASETTGDL